MTDIPKILTIAGSDSGGGAGIQADVRTGSTLGCHVSTAITAVTMQNSLGVQGVHPLPAPVVAAQMESVLSDIGADSAKTGMLFEASIIEAVAESIRRHKVSRLVVDPVMVAKGGARLLQDGHVEALKTRLIPLATLVTPNLPEAEVLTGVKVTDRDSALTACRLILKMGPGAVLLKGGHSEGEMVEDLLLTQGGVERLFLTPRIDTCHSHGTGCTLSAAISAYLARGEELPQAVARAHSFLQRALRSAYATGLGHGATNPMAAGGDGGEVLERLHRAWELLEEGNPVGLIPEVQSNLAEALENAASFKEVAAFPGRLLKKGRRVAKVDGPRFGASRHMAKILLAGARRQSPFLSVMNIRYGADVLFALHALGFRVGGFSRKEEPLDIKAAEGSTLEWGTGRVIDELGYTPDAIYDEGDDGKEPMIRIFGVDAIDTAKKVLAVWGELLKNSGKETCVDAY